jgi:hypothetical protein
MHQIRDSAYTNGTNKEGTKRAQTGGEGEYQNWRELLGKNSASPENSHKKIHATPVQMDHP